MSTLSLTNILDSITSAINRATTWDQTKIDQIVAGLQKDIAIVENDIVMIGTWLVNDGPTLIGYGAALAGILGKIPGIPGAVVSAITAAVSDFQQVIDAIEAARNTSSNASAAASALSPFGGADMKAVAVEGYRRRQALALAVANGRSALAKKKAA
jgi:hypothetical protein